MTSASDRLRDVYERRAELEYPEPPPRPDRATQRKFARVLELVEPHLPCDAFLDAGCGDGIYLEAVGGAAARVAGTDISQRILETARATAARGGIDPELVQANLERLPFGDGEFDLVLCTQVIEHLLDPESGMLELARVLRPGGTLVVTTDNARNRVTQALNAPRTALVGLLRLRGRRLKVHFPHASFTPPGFAELVRTTGLVPRETLTFRFHLEWPFDHPAAQRLLDRLDDALQPHTVGDLVAIVAEKPG